VIYLPDTDIVNFLVKGNRPVEERFQREVDAGADLALSVIVHYEVTRYYTLKGAVRARRSYEALVSDWAVVDLFDADWALAADLWAARHRAGSPITDMDLLVAVTALKVGAVLVTNNTRHFGDLGLTLENWWSPSR
jgi:tRNA(fMet)-specific endonuclease VapC